MGSIAALIAGRYLVALRKNGVDPDIMTIFREDDRRHLLGADPDLDDDDTRLVFKLFDFRMMDADTEECEYFVYAATCEQIRDRLDLMGFTLDRVRKEFDAIELDRRDWGLRPFRSPPNPFVVKPESLESWLGKLERGNPGEVVDLTSSDRDNPAWSSVTLDFPQRADTRILLRAILETCDSTDSVVLDLTDLIEGGWYDASERVCETALARLREEEQAYGRIIVLTEGSTDQIALERTLAVLHPHLSGYFSFMDFTTSNASGGAPALASMIKGFAGAGILNRIVALFDNDTAGTDALRALRRTQLPDNIRVLQYPRLDIAASYPTLGPSGLVSLDVNGLAGSIELYFGEDVLRGPDGELEPVQWRGYNGTLNQYQGEVLNKPRLQRCFLEKVKRSESDKEFTNAADWTGMGAILSALRRAFL
jgi:hypothetical protein